MPALLVHVLDAKGLASRYVAIDTLDALTGWSISGAGGTQAVDAVNFRAGTGGYKQTVPASIAAVSTKAFGPINLSGVGSSDEVRFWVYVDDASRVSAASIQMIDSQGSPVTATYTLTGLVNGWNRYSIAKTAFTNGGTIHWNTIATIKLNVTATAGGTVNVTWDMLRLMLGPTINYTQGRWDESHGMADVVDGRIKFWDAGYWQINDTRLQPIDFYRLDSAASGITVSMQVGYVRISGLNGTFSSLEILVASWDSKKALMLESPEYYRGSTVMDSIWTSEALPVSQLIAAIIDTFRQSYFTRATYLLPVHEMVMGGDQSGSGLSITARRNQLMERYIEAFLPMDRDNMRRLVEFFVNSASVTHDPSTYTFTVHIIDPKGPPPNLGQIQAAIERAKPAHLGYTVVFTFTDWNTMDAYNRPWNSADTYTWDNFEVS